MRNIFFIKTMFFCLVLFGCSGEDIENRQLATDLGALDAGATFSMDTIMPVSYDSVYIVTPYLQLDSIQILKNNDIPYKLHSLLDYNKYQDSHCVLLFAKEGRIVQYAEVGLAIANFSWLERDVYGDKQVYALDSTRRVSEWIKGQE